MESLPLDSERILYDWEAKKTSHAKRNPSGKELKHVVQVITMDTNTLGGGTNMLFFPARNGNTGQGGSDYLWTRQITNDAPHINPLDQRQKKEVRGDEAHIHAVRLHVKIGGFPTTFEASEPRYVPFRLMLIHDNQAEMGNLFQSDRFFTGQLGPGGIDGGSGWYDFFRPDSHRFNIVWSKIYHMEDYFLQETYVGDLEVVTTRLFSITRFEELEILFDPPLRQQVGEWNAMQPDSGKVNCGNGLFFVLATEPRTGPIPPNTNADAEIQIGCMARYTDPTMPGAEPAISYGKATQKPVYETDH